MVNEMPYEIYEQALPYIKEAMDIHAKEIAIEYIKWFINEFNTDEGRLPISGNRLLGGQTIFINHKEYPISHTYELFLQSKNQKQ